MNPQSRRYKFRGQLTDKFYYTIFREQLPTVQPLHSREYSGFTDRDNLKRHSSSPPAYVQSTWQVSWTIFLLTGQTVTSRRSSMSMWDVSRYGAWAWIINMGAVAAAPASGSLHNYWCCGRRCNRDKISVRRTSETSPVEALKPFDAHCCHTGTTTKHPVPNRVCNFWHPGTLTLKTERQSARMSKITNDCWTRSDTVCFIAVPIWQQWASKG